MQVEVAHKPTSSLRKTLCKLKDPIKPHDQTGVVYCIPCLNCDSNYVGETAKQLKTRLHEHQLALKRADVKSHLWQHCAQTGHEVSLADTHVIASTNKKGERLVLESIHSRNAYNRCIDLDSHYAPLVDKIRGLQARDRQANKEE